MHFGPNRSCSDHFSLIWSILSTLVLFGPIQYTLVLLGPLWSNLVHFVHFDLIWSYSIHCGFIRFTLVLFSPPCPLWFYSVISVQTVHFGLNRPYLIYLGPIRSYSVHSIHFGLIWSNWVLFGPIWSSSVHLGPFYPLWFYSVQFGLIRSILFTLALFYPIQSTLILFGPFGSMRSSSVLFNSFCLFSLIWSTLIHSVLFGPL